MANNILALDIGEKRIGVARANVIAKLPTPLITLANDDSFGAKLLELTKKWDVDVVVIGLPRNLSGEETAQSQFTKEFALNNLKDFKIIWQDETLSTKAAKEMSSSGSAGVDADAACIILEDYLKDKNEIQ